MTTATKVKHTPGEWEPVFEIYYDGPNVCVGVGATTSVAGIPYSTMVCNSMRPDSDEEYVRLRENIEADMRLCAAAPELLEALQEAKEEIEYWHSDMLSEKERNHPRGSGWARVYDNINAAISKALGTTNK